MNTAAFLADLPAWARSRGRTWAIEEIDEWRRLAATEGPALTSEEDEALAGFRARLCDPRPMTLAEFAQPAQDGQVGQIRYQRAAK